MRRLQVLFFLLFGCLPPTDHPVIRLHVRNLPVQTEQLQVTPVIAGRAQPPQILPVQTTTDYEVSVPTAAQALVTLRVDALAQGGCHLARGQGQTSFPAEPVMRALDVCLMGLDVPECPVRVQFQGDGQGAVMWAQVGRDPMRCTFDCPSKTIDDASYSFFVRAGVPVDVTMTAAPGSYLWPITSAPCEKENCRLIPMQALTLRATWAQKVCDADQCWTSPLPQGHVLHGVWGTSPQDVWAVGDAGMVLHYDGTFWQRAWYGQRNLRAIWGNGQGRIWIAGDQTLLCGVQKDGIWRWTANCGAVSGTLYALAGTQIQGEDRLLAVGDDGMFFTWQAHKQAWWPALQTFTTDSLRAAWIRADGEQYVGSVQGNLWHGTGTTWTLVPNLPQGSVRALTGTSSALWIGGDERVLMRLPFQEQDPQVVFKTKAPIWALTARGSQVLAAGPQMLLEYSGTTWADRSPRLTSFVQGAYYTPEHALLVGASGWVGVLNQDGQVDRLSR